ncbi:MAG: rhodanese-like domain-containing protein [Gammaproteobacteria bacterium]|nr:rhodanese-like domain-containing protein [Gammaproteobacteria bacterium]
MFVKEIEAAELAQLLAGDESVELIDVRTPGEAARGVIAGGQNLPLHLLPLHADQIAQRGRKVVFYCRSGARSGQACMFMAQRGFDEAYNLRGGIISWVRNGEELVDLRQSA